MYMLKVTIAASNTPQCIIPEQPVIQNSNTAFQVIYLQNNGSNSMYLGDSKVSNTNGILLTIQGSLTGTQTIAQASDLKEFFVYGTAGDVLNIMVFP